MYSSHAMDAPPTSRLTIDTLVCNPQSAVYLACLGPESGPVKSHTLAEFLVLGPEPKFINGINNLTQTVAALNLVFDFSKNLAYFVLNGVRPRGLLREPVEIGKELLIHEIPEVIAGESPVMVEFTIRAFSISSSLSLSAFPIL